MRREVDFEILGSIFDERKVCIRPNGGNNYEKAKQDFEGGRVRYYSFLLEDATRGYARFVEDPLEHALILDFISPWGNKEGWDAVKYLAQRLKDRVEVLIPQTNINDSLKPYCVEKGSFELTETSFGIAHRQYCVGKKVLSFITDVPHDIIPEYKEEYEED